MRIIPLGLGQSDGTLVFWDNHPEIEAYFNKATEAISEVRWGAGALEEQPFLVLYLFTSTQAVEMYLPETLPTSVDTKIPVWATILNWKPQVLKVRYGNLPTDGEHEVTLLLPKGPGELCMDKLDDFVRLTRQQMDKGPVDETTAYVIEQIETIVTPA